MTASWRAFPYKWPSWRFMFIMIPWFIGMFLSGYDGLQRADSARHQSIATGTFVAYDLGNHNQCWYTFIADGQRYRSESSVGSVPPNLGDPATVFYDARYPKTNSLDPFNETSKRSLTFAAMLLTAITGLAVAILISKLWLRYSASLR